MRLKDIINPHKWVSYIKWKNRQWFGKLTPEEQAWQAEVIVFRGYMCPECKANGKCVGVMEGETEACGCDFIGKSTDMSETCSIGMWKEVNSKQDWEDFKNKVLVGKKIGIHKD